VDAAGSSSCCSVMVPPAHRSASGRSVKPATAALDLVGARDVAELPDSVRRQRLQKVKLADMDALFNQQILVDRVE
jgi:hypothetical protein